MSIESQKESQEFLGIKTELINLKKEILRNPDGEPTEQQKNKMYERCKEKIEDIKIYLKELTNDKISEEMKEELYYETLCKFFNKNFTVLITSNEGKGQVLSKDEFREKIRNKKINLSDFVLSSVKYNLGEFQKIEIDTPEGMEIIYYRLMNTLTLTQRGTAQTMNLSNTYIGGISDIAPAAPSLTK